MIRLAAVLSSVYLITPRLASFAQILSTQTNFAQTVVGTPYYLSPELCEDKPYNEKSDVWALGVCLYECCTKRHPFDADNQVNRPSCIMLPLSVAIVHFVHALFENVSCSI